LEQAKLNIPSLPSAAQLSRVSLQDTAFEAVDWGAVSCAVFACGTERRSTALFEILPGGLHKRALVLEFEDNDPQLKQRQVFASQLSEDQFIVPGTDLKFVIEAISDRLNASNTSQNTIFVDISSMPRKWYLGLIMWIRFSGLPVRIILGYAGASYPDVYPERQILGFHPISGTGGFYDASQPVWAVVSLGFDAGAAVSLEERIEPDRIICVMTRSDVNHHELARAERANAELIGRCEEVLYIPNMSFSRPLQAISELIAPLDCANIVCVPLGPKTHVVAFALAGLMYPRATNVHVISRYTHPFQADSNGSFCFGQLDFIMHPSSA
jgi:hypothetical protein